MNDPLITRFAQACGAAAPLDLRVGLADGGVLAEGTVRQPFTLLGRDEACDVTLNDPDVHPRHAWFQVLDGRVFGVDLGSRAGVVWADGTRGPGWVDPGAAVRVGPFRVTLRNPVSARPPRPGFAPAQADPDLARTRPAVELEFRNGRRPKDRWAVNRVLTLVGRADACKLHLGADDVAPYHCGLVLTPVGLWVVDLSGGGVVVNGERMRVAPLPDGAELAVGRFRITCRVPGADPSTVRLVPGRRTPPPAFPTPADDEVALGGLPGPDPAGGLPSSHILHGTFRRPGSSGGMSAPVLVAAGPASGARSSARLGVPVPAPDATPAEPPAAALIGSLAEIHAGTADHARQALALLARVCGDARAAQELGRIKELNAELARLQTEVTRLALAEAAAPAQGDTAVHDLSRTPPGGVRTPAGSDAILDWVRERIGLLHRERQTRWERVAAALGSRGVEE